MMFRSRSHLDSLPLTAALATLLTLPGGCKQHGSEASPAASASVAVSALAPPASASSANKVPSRFLVATGPRLAVLAGKGVGPIRLGATVETIERLMDAPCEERTPDLCRYLSRAVEFHLADGQVDWIRVHRHSRPAGGINAYGRERVFGVFNGKIPPDVQFRMTVEGVQMTLGKPTRVERVNDETFGTRELHHYPGMILEYDTIGSPQLVLGGVRIVAGG